MQKARREWMHDFRGVFGCEARPNEGCWCEVCCAMSRAWERAMDTATRAIDRERHPADVEREKQAAAAEGGDDAD